jgi:hypothetical protein
VRRLGAVVVDAVMLDVMARVRVRWWGASLGYVYLRGRSSISCRRFDGRIFSGI